MRGLVPCAILAALLAACCPRSRYQAKLQQAVDFRVKAAADLARAEGRALGAGGGAAEGRRRPADDQQPAGAESGDELPDFGLRRGQLEEMVRKAIQDIDPVTADALFEAIRAELGPTPEEVEAQAVQGPGEAGEAGEAGESVPEEPDVDEPDVDEAGPEEDADSEGESATEDGAEREE